MGCVLGLGQWRHQHQRVLFDTSGRQVASAKRQTAMSTPAGVYRAGYGRAVGHELPGHPGEMVVSGWTQRTSWGSPRHGKGLYLWGKTESPPGRASCPPTAAPSRWWRIGRAKA